MDRLPYRGISRGDDLIPTGKVSLGDRVWWRHTYWLAGEYKDLT